MPTPTTQIGLTYAGVPLLLPDPDGVVQAWLDRWLPLDDLQNVTTWQRSPWRTWSVPLPNYPAPLKIRLNTWYNPIGASRWGFGLFLTNYEGLLQILQNFRPGTYAPLKMTHTNTSSGTGTTVEKDAYLLPARPISASATESDYLPEDVSGLYLLPLVDVRYYWQFFGAGCYTMDSSGVAASQLTWNQLMESLATKLQTQIELSSDNNLYAKPDPVNWNAGGCANPAVGLDAAAWCTGTRIVRWSRGTSASSKPWKAMTLTESLAQVRENLSGPSGQGTFLAGALQYGGSANLYLRSLMPEAVDVCFRAWSNGITVDPPSYYVKRHYASQFSLQSVTGAVQVLQTTAYANYTNIPDATPSNKEKCDDLALRLAQDFYRQFAWVQNSVYHGLVPWQETGLDNYYEYCAGSQNHKTGEYECSTRIHTVPHNLGVQTFLHWLDGTKDYPQTIEGKLDDSLSPYKTATLSVWNEAGYDSTLNVKVTDRIGWNAPAGAWCVAEKVNNQWRPVAISCGVYSPPPEV